MHLILFVFWNLMTYLTKSHKNKKQKDATGLLLDKLLEEDFAGPVSSRASRVLEPISRHRVADILVHMKSVSHGSRPGLLVGFFRTQCNSLCRLCIAQRFLTLKNMITPAVLDAQMNLILSRRTMSVTGCTTSLSLSGDMLRYCRKEFIYYTT